MKQVKLRRNGRRCSTVSPKGRSLSLRVWSRVGQRKKIERNTKVSLSLGHKKAKWIVTGHDRDLSLLLHVDQLVDTVDHTLHELYLRGADASLVRDVELAIGA